MVKKTLCLLVVLVLIAQICAIPVPGDKDDTDKAKEAKDKGSNAAKVAEDAAKATKDKGDDAKKKVAVPDDKENGDAVKKATEEEKKKEGDLGHVADTANATATKAVHAEKKGTHGTHPHAKDCKKQPGLVSGAIETVDDIGKKAVDTGVHAMADFFKMFGL